MIEIFNVTVLQKNEPVSESRKHIITFKTKERFIESYKKRHKLSHATTICLAFKQLENKTNWQKFRMVVENRIRKFNN